MNTPNHQTARQQGDDAALLDKTLHALTVKDEPPAAAEPPDPTRRIAPRTIRIGNYDVPEPYRGEMEEEQEYYVPAVDNRHFQSSFQWGGDSFDKRYMNLGIIHLTPEAAALHGKALASLTAGEGVEL